MRAFSLIILTSFITLLTFSCEKEEDTILEYAVRIEAEVDPSSAAHFAIVKKSGQLEFLTAEKALARAGDINFVWEQSSDGEALDLYAPNHPKVKERFPELADKLTASTTFRSNGLDKAAIDDLYKNGTKAEAKQLYESAAPQADPYQIRGGRDIGISALMDRARWATLIWEYTYDDQGRMLFATVIGVEFHP